jgi:hypothetical protein
VTVKYTGTTVITNGTAASLTVGARVEAHGTLAADGVTLDADSIKIKTKL